MRLAVRFQTKSLPGGLALSTWPHCKFVDWSRAGNRSLSHPAWFCVNP